MELQKKLKKFFEWKFFKWEIKAFQMIGYIVTNLCMNVYLLPFVFLLSLESSSVDWRIFLHLLQAQPNKSFCMSLLFFFMDFVINIVLDR